MADDRADAEGVDHQDDDGEEGSVLRFYRGLRRDVSLLLSEGHAIARYYPLATVWSEVRIVRQRIAQQNKQNAVVMQTVIGSLFSKEGAKQLVEILKRLDDVG